jgi:nicotinate-nucleotide pyrophosphorylase (carboxylating)
MPRKVLEERLRKMLAEDLGQGDVTSAALIPPDTKARAEVIAKETGTVAGVEEAAILAESLGLKVNSKIADGEEIKKGESIMRITGDARTILGAERTMLNLLSRMSGIATTTKELTSKIRKARLTTRIAATRKTAPGMLYFDKKAVLLGGGDTHRFHLDDLILIKDNHIAIVGSVEEAVKKAKLNASFTKKIEVEATTPEDALAAARAGADIIMLDNFSPSRAKHTTELLEKAGVKKGLVLEASGGINVENLLEYASTGANVLSLGALTHSARNLDLSLEIAKVN